MAESEAEILVEPESSDVCIGDTVGISLEPEMQSLEHISRKSELNIQRNEKVHI